MVMQFFCVQIKAGKQSSLVAEPWNGSASEVTESQNHSMVGVGRDLCGSSSPTLPSKQGPRPRTVLTAQAPELEQASNFKLPEATGAELRLNEYGATHRLIRNCKIVRFLLSRHQNLVLIAPKLVSIIEIE